MDRWTWRTYYWRAKIQFDVGFPVSLAGVPADLPAPWSSYPVRTAYDQAISGAGVTCVNPYLETLSGIPDDINSNRVSRHGMASVGATNGVTGPYPPPYTDNNIFKIPVDFADPSLYGGKTKTDFSWAVGNSP